MSKARRTSSSSDEFAEAWNAMDKADRKRIRRLVRVGRPVDTRDEAVLAVGYADHLRARLAWRLFWVWLLPALVVALVAAINIHPILVGVVLAVAANAIFVHWNVGRVAKVNAALLST